MISGDDHIVLYLECPDCGARVAVPVSQIRLYRTAACACGLLIRLGPKEKEAMRFVSDEDDAAGIPKG